MNKRFIIIVLVLLISLVVLSYNPLRDEYDQRQVMVELKKTATAAYLNHEIRVALQAEHIDDALIYYELADYMEVGLDAEVEHRIRKEATVLKTLLRTGKGLVGGFFLGQSDNVSGMLGSMVSDLTAWGDIRDFGVQTTRWLSGKPIDAIVYGLSTVGVISSFGIFITGPVSGSIDVGLSIAKNARKMGLISVRMTHEIQRILDQAVDFSLLRKKLNFDLVLNPAKLKEILASAVNRQRLIDLHDSLVDLTSIADHAGSLGEAVKILKYADTFDDLKRIRKLSKDFGKHTLVVLKVLGNQALHTIQWTLTNFIFLVSSLVSLIYVIMSASVMFFGLVRRSAQGNRMKPLLDKRAKKVT